MPVRGGASFGASKLTGSAAQDRKRSHREGNLDDDESDASAVAALRGAATISSSLTPREHSVDKRLTMFQSVLPAWTNKRAHIIPAVTWKLLDSNNK